MFYLMTDMRSLRRFCIGKQEQIQGECGWKYDKIKMKYAKITKFDKNEKVNSMLSIDLFV